MNNTKIKKNIHQMVLAGEENTFEFDNQLHAYISSIIVKKYGIAILMHHDFNELVAAGIVGFFEGCKKYDFNKGNVCAYTYYYIMHQVHKTYCQILWNVSIYYANIRKYIIESVNEYYNHKDKQLLHNTLLKHGVNKKALKHLIRKNSLDSEYAIICANII